MIKMRMKTEEQTRRGGKEEGKKEVRNKDFTL